MTKMQRAVHVVGVGMIPFTKPGASDPLQPHATGTPRQDMAEMARRAANEQTAFLENHGALLRERAAQGRIVEAHGDLRPEHIFLDGTPRIIDDENADCHVTGTSTTSVVPAPTADSIFKRPLTSSKSTSAKRRRRHSARPSSCALCTSASKSSSVPSSGSTTRRTDRRSPMPTGN